MRRAVLYVPGSSQHLFAQSATLVADRIARSLRDRLADQAPLAYRVTRTADVQELASGIGLDRVSIEVARGKEWLPALDLFELKYLESFTRRFGDLPPLARGAWAAKLVFRHLPSAVAAMLRSGTPKGTLDKMQASFLGLIVLVSLTSLAYWLMIGLLGLTGLQKLFGGGGDAGHLLAVAGVAVGALTAGRFAFKDFVEALEKSAIEFYAMIAYLSDGRRFAAAPNAVCDALGYLEGQGYDGVDLLAFSFGGLVSADAIFPRQMQLRSAPLAVGTWVTIGYPYDLIASTYPRYFAGRQRGPIAPSQWLNVVTVDDFLGSTFRRDDRETDPETGQGIHLASAPGAPVAPDRNVFFKPSLRAVRHWLRDLVPFRRLRNHVLYWDENDAFAPSCFGELVEPAGWVAAVRAVAAGQ